jgi:hypothetical protein
VLPSRSTDGFDIIVAASYVEVEGDGEGMGEVCNWAVLKPAMVA